MVTDLWSHVNRDGNTFLIKEGAWLGCEWPPWSCDDSSSIFLTTEWTLSAEEYREMLLKKSFFKGSRRGNSVTTVCKPYSNIPLDTGRRVRNKCSWKSAWASCGAGSPVSSLDSWFGWKLEEWQKWQTWQLTAANKSRDFRVLTAKAQRRLSKVRGVNLTSPLTK